MKRIFIFSICVSIMTLSANGQSETLKNVLGGRKAGVISLSTSNETDTIPKVVYVKTQETARQPAYYVNDKLSSSSILKTIDPQFIDNFRVEQNEIEIDGKRYYGQVFIKMKNEYNPQLISLPDLVAKYTKLKSNRAIFMIDNEFINDDYDQFLVDEKYILEIVVNTIENANVDVVKFLTRSKENIEKQFFIRGSGDFTMK